MRDTLIAIAGIFMISTPQIMGARTWERSSLKISSKANNILKTAEISLLEDKSTRTIRDNGVQGIKSYGRHNKNAEAIAKANSKSGVHNKNNMNGSYDDTLQDGKSRNRLKNSEANAMNKALIEDSILSIYSSPYIQPSYPSSYGQSSYTSPYSQPSYAPYNMKPAYTSGYNQQYGLGYAPSNPKMTYTPSYSASTRYGEEEEGYSSHGSYSNSPTYATPSYSQPAYTPTYTAYNKPTPTVYSKPAPVAYAASAYTPVTYTQPTLPTYTQPTPSAYSQPPSSPYTPKVSYATPSYQPAYNSDDQPAYSSYGQPDYTSDDDYETSSMSNSKSNVQGVRSYGKNNANAQGISNDYSTANVMNSNTVNGNYNTAVQVGKAQAKIDSSGNSKNKVFKRQTYKVRKYTS